VVAVRLVTEFGQILYPAFTWTNHLCGSLSYAATIKSVLHQRFFKLAVDAATLMRSHGQK